MDQRQLHKVNVTLIPSAAHDKPILTCRESFTAFSYTSKRTSISSAAHTCCSTANPCPSCTCTRCGHLQRNNKVMQSCQVGQANTEAGQPAYVTLVSVAAHDEPILIILICRESFTTTSGSSAVHTCCSTASPCTSCTSARCGHFQRYTKAVRLVEQILRLVSQLTSKLFQKYSMSPNQNHLPDCIAHWTTVYLHGHCESIEVANRSSRILN